MNKKILLKIISMFAIILFMTSLISLANNLDTKSITTNNETPINNSKNNEEKSQELSNLSESKNSTIEKTDFISKSIEIKNDKGEIVDRAMLNSTFKIDMKLENRPFAPFVKVFGGSKNDHLYKTIRDGNTYVSVGETYSTNKDVSTIPSKGDNDMLFIKYDNEGNIIWRKTFGGSTQDYSTGIINDVNGGYTVVGWGGSDDYDFASSGSKYVDGAVVRLSEEGNIIWSKKIGGYNLEELQGIVQTSDKGYLCTGYTTSQLPYGTSQEKVETDAYIVKLDQYGNIKKETRFGTKASEAIQTLVLMDDGNYLAVGTKKSNTMASSKNGKMDGLLLKITPDGDVIWAKEFGGSNDDLFRTITKTSDGNFIIAGYTYSTDKDLLNVNRYYNEQEGWILKVNPNGNILWQKTFGGTGIDYFLGAISTNEGVLLSGFSSANNRDLAGINNGKEDAIITYFTNDGNLIWKRTFGGSENERLRSIVDVPGGGYLITGDTYSNDGPVKGLARGGSDGLIVKFDSDGSTTLKNYDTILDKIQYKVEGVTRNGSKTLLEGTYTNQTILRNQTISKIANLKIPRDNTILEIKITLSLTDSNDIDKSNNTIILKVPVVSEDLDTDFAITEGRLTDPNGTKYNEFLPNKTHVFEFDIKNQSGRPFIFTFGGSGTEHFEKHTLTKDGGFLAVGRTSSSDYDLANHKNKGDYDALIVKYNYKGDVEWSKTFGGSKLDFFYHAVQTQDGNYVAVGTSASNNGDMSGSGAIDEDAIMVKYNSKGNILWKKHFKANGRHGRILYILEDDLGYLYTASEEHVYSSSYPGAVYRKLDKNGNQIWLYSVNTPSKINNSNAYGMTILENGDIIGVGRDTNTTTTGPYRGNYEPYMIRLNGSTGKLIWRTNLYGNYSDDFRQVVEADDGTLFAIGRTMSTTGDFQGITHNAGGSVQDAFVAKLNKTTGKLLTLKVIGGTGYDNFRYLEKIKGGYLISGDTDKASGDFKNLKINKQDALWLKMKDNMEIEWISLLSGSGNEATQSGMRLSEDNYIVSGETNSNDGHFKGLLHLNNGKATTDAFIAKLNKYGELVTGKHDENISQVDYKIEAKYKSGIIKVIKEGSFFDVYAPMESTITKKVEFKTLEDTNVEKLILTATLSDIQDINEKNNHIRIEYDMSPIIGQDFLVDGYNIKNSNKEVTTKLEINNKYSFNTNIFNKGVYSNKKITLDNKLDKLTYKITAWDGLNENSKIVLSSGTKTNLKIDFESNIWSSIDFTIPDNNRLNEVIFELGISDANDMITTNNTLNIRLPIHYNIENDIGIKDDKDDEADGVTIYPVSYNNTSTTADDCYVTYGSPTTIKAVVGSTNIKTQNLKATLVINGKDVETKTVYGVSSDMPSAVYFNYTLDDKNNVYSEEFKLQVRISPADGTKEYFTGKEIYKNLSDPISVKVVQPPSATTENSYPVNNNVTKLSIGESVAYIKVKKVDRDKLVTYKDATPCQKLENGTKICPGHTKYVYDENAKPYDAFIPVDTIKLDNIKQNHKIENIRFKSKYTKENMDSEDIKDILYSNDGFINILDRYGNIPNTTKSQIKIKAGYGFELEVDTKYDNNLPEIFEKVRLLNQPIKETAWSKFQNYSGTNIKILYNNIDKEVSKYTGAIGIVVPGVNDIAIQNTSNLYIKTPTSQNEFLEVEQGLNNKSKDAKYNVSQDKTLYEIKRTYKITSKNNSSIEKYYVNKEVQNGNYEFKIFVPRAGIGALCDTKMPKLKDAKTFEIQVYGGYLDDIKTHLNE